MCVYNQLLDTWTTGKASAWVITIANLKSKVWWEGDLMAGSTRGMQVLKIIIYKYFTNLAQAHTSNMVPESV